MKLKYTKVAERLEGPEYLARLELGKGTKRKLESLVRQNTTYIIWGRGTGNVLVMSSNEIEKLSLGRN